MSINILIWLPYLVLNSHKFHFIISDQTALPSMRDLVHAVVSKIPSKWRAVGTELKMPTGTLDKIQEHNAQKPDKDSVSFEHMLCIWMQQDLLRPCPKVQPFGPFTWRSIIEALRAIGEIDLAETLTNNHIHTSMLRYIQCIQIAAGCQ